MSLRRDHCLSLGVTVSSSFPSRLASLCRPRRAWLFTANAWPRPAERHVGHSQHHSTQNGAPVAPRSPPHGRAPPAGRGDCRPMLPTRPESVGGQGRGPSGDCPTRVALRHRRPQPPRSAAQPLLAPRSRTPAHAPREVNRSLCRRRYADVKPDVQPGPSRPGGAVPAAGLPPRCRVHVRDQSILGHLSSYQVMIRHRAALVADVTPWLGSRSLSRFTHSFHTSGPALRHALPGLRGWGTSTRHRSAGLPAVPHRHPHPHRRPHLHPHPHRRPRRLHPPRGDTAADERPGRRLRPGGETGTSGSCGGSTRSTGWAARPPGWSSPCCSWNSVTAPAPRGRWPVPPR